MASDKRMAGRVALITGGGGEIGSAIAARYATAGAAIAVGDVEPKKAEATAANIRASGGKCIGFTLDVGDPGSA